MKFKAAILSAWCLIAVSPSALADDTVTINGLPCGAFCREWLGINLDGPHKPAADNPAEDTKAQKRSDDAERSEKTKRTKVHRKTEIASHKALKEKAAGERKEAKPEPTETPLAISDARKTAPAPPGVKPAREPAKSASSPNVSAAPPIEQTPAAEIPKPANEVDHVVKPAAIPDASAETTPPPKGTLAEAPKAKSESNSKPEDSASAITASPSPDPIVEPKEEEVAKQSEEPIKAPAPAPSGQPVVAATQVETPELKPPSPSAAPSVAAAASPTPALPTGPKASADAATFMIVLVTPKVKDLADLSEKSILVAGLSQISRDALTASFESSGASKVEFKRGEPYDLGPLVRGEVSAVVVATVPAAMESFSEVDGFRVLRVPVLALPGAH